MDTVSFDVNAFKGTNDLKFNMMKAKYPISGILVQPCSSSITGWNHELQTFDSQNK